MRIVKRRRRDIDMKSPDYRLTTSKSLSAKVLEFLGMTGTFPSKALLLVGG